MILREWLKKNGHSQVWAASILGIKPYILSNVINNKSQPSLWLVMNIHDLTRGEVRIEDWISESVIEKIAEQNKLAARSEL